MDDHPPVIVAVPARVAPGVHDVAVVSLALHSPHLPVLVLLVVPLVCGAVVGPGLRSAAAS